MKINPMLSTPSSRAELERNLFLLGESMRRGKVMLDPRLRDTIDGLRRLRKLPNSRFDLLSLNESARLLSNMIASDLRTGLSPGEVENAGDPPDVGQEHPVPE